MSVGIVSALTNYNNLYVLLLTEVHRCPSSALLASLFESTDSYLSCEGVFFLIFFDTSYVEPNNPRSDWILVCYWGVWALYNTTILERKPMHLTCAGICDKYVEFFFIDTTPFVDAYWIPVEKRTFDWRGIGDRAEYLKSQLEVSLLHVFCAALIRF